MTFAIVLFIGFNAFATYGMALSFRKMVRGLLSGRKDASSHATQSVSMQSGLDESSRDRLNQTLTAARNRGMWAAVGAMVRFKAAGKHGNRRAAAQAAVAARSRRKGK